jgi:hypothetical protein
MPWSVIDQLEDPADQWQAFHAMFLKTADEMAPWMKKRVKGYDVPYINSDLGQLMSERDKAKTLANKTNDPGLFQKFKSLKNRVTLLNRQLKDEYYNTLAFENLGNQEKLWKSLKKILPQSQTASHTYSLREGDQTHTSNNSVANCFNNFLATIGSKLAEKFQSNQSDFPKYPPFKFEEITPDSVNKQLQHLDSRKATGTDNLNARLLKDGAHIISFPLAKIMNTSLRTGKIPLEWKQASVTPIFKAGDPQEASNYRPISILPICMKVFECAVHTQLYAFVQANGILCINHSGFRKSHSTCTALIEVTDTILSNMNEGLLTGAVYLDLKKAFDTVDHQTVLKRMSSLGIKDTELSWFSDYLDNRKQCVRINNTESEYLQVNCGVPQGSILGPLLFILYVNDLPNVIQNSKIFLYADDTLLLFASNDTNKIKRALEQDLKHATEWFSINKLHLNVNKTKWTLFGTWQRLRLSDLPDISVNGENLEHVDEYKYLGLHLDSHLDWNHHISHVAGKISKRLGVLKRVRRHLNLFTAKMLYNALVLPMFDYCDVVLSNMNLSQLDRLQKLQNRGARILLGLDSRSHVTDMMENLKWLNVKQRCELHTATMVYKIKNNIAPPYLTQLLSNEHSSHSYETRSTIRGDLNVPNARLKAKQRTFQYRGSNIWNELPINIRNAPSLNAFKSACTAFMLQ